jgi:hypothetical protein
MRLVDLLRPYLADLDRLVDLTPRSVDLRPHLLLPEGIAYEAAVAGGFSGTISKGCVAVLLLGPDRALHCDPDDVIAVLDRLVLGGRLLILFVSQPSELPYQRLLDPLVRNRGQVLQVGLLDHAPIRAGAVVEAVDHLVPPRDATGAPIAPDPTDAADRLALEIRLADEWIFGDLVANVLRQEGASTGHAGHEQLTQERRRWQLQIAERDSKIAKLERSVERLEHSGSLEVGRLFVRAGRSPRLALRLPADLLRLWRTRG